MTMELKEHIHRKQVAANNLFNTDLKQGQAILHVEDSKSYRNKHQDEIQSTSFGQSTSSLFIAFVYHLNDSESLIQRPITVVSDSSNHSWIAMFMFIDFIIKEVEKHVALTKVIL